MLKTIEFKIEKGRDKGKLFLITEMTARQADIWSTKAMFAITKGGIAMPEMTSTGMAGLARAGLPALLLAPYDTIEPLLNELMACVKIIPNPNDKSVLRPLIDEDIEDYSNYTVLRDKVFGLMTDFFQSGEA
jgi:hypothetical protein